MEHTQHRAMGSLTDRGTDKQTYTDGHKDRRPTPWDKQTWTNWQDRQPYTQWTSTDWQTEWKTNRQRCTLKRSHERNRHKQTDRNTYADGNTERQTDRETDWSWLEHSCAGWAQRRRSWLPSCVVGRPPHTSSHHTQTDLMTNKSNNENNSTPWSCTFLLIIKTADIWLRKILIRRGRLWADILTENP